MTERPIPFSGPMVRAILDGRKTQTRRVVEFNGFHQHGRSGGQVGYSWIEHKPTARGVTCDMQDLLTLCPYGQPGDRLWVREAWRTSTGADDRPGSVLETQGQGYGWPIWYAADDGAVTWRGAGAGGPSFTTPGRYRSSRFMPRWASRITLEVTGVRVERVQDITANDAINEGVLTDSESSTEWSARCMSRGRFRETWDAVNAKRGAGWDANPWVWVIEFRRIDK